MNEEWQNVDKQYGSIKKRNFKKRAKDSTPNPYCFFTKPLLQIDLFRLMTSNSSYFIHTFFTLTFHFQHTVFISLQGGQAYFCQNQLLTFNLCSISFAYHIRRYIVFRKVQRLDFTRLKVRDSLKSSKHKTLGRKFFQIFLNVNVEFFKTQFNINTDESARQSDFFSHQFLLANIFFLSKQKPKIPKTNNFSVDLTVLFTRR